MMTKLRFYRVSEEMSMAQAARRLGLDLPIYSRLEDGRLRPNDREMAIMQRTFGANAAAMLEPVPDLGITDGRAIELEVAV